MTMNSGTRGRTNMACSLMAFGLLLVFNLDSVHAKDGKITKPLNIVTVLGPPFVMKDPDTGRFSGLLIDVLNQTGIPIDHIDTPVQDAYGWEQSPGVFDGAVGDLVDGKYDLAVGPFSIRAERASVITFTQPVLHSGYMVLYKLPGDDDSQWTSRADSMATMLKPFSAALWGIIALATVLISVALHVIRRFSPYELDVTTPATAQGADDPLGKISWGRVFMYLLGSLTGGNASVTPRSTSGRILTGVWSIFSMMTVGAYVAGLGLVIYNFEPHPDSPPFSSVDQMISGTDIKVLAVKNSTTYKYMAGHYGFYERKMVRYWKANWDSVMVDSFTEALKMLNEGNGQYGVFMDEALADYLASQDPCDKVVIGKPVGDDIIGFACRKGSTVCDEMNQVILDLHENGEIERLREKWFYNECRESAEVVLKGKMYFDTFGGKEPGLLSIHSITIRRFSAAFLVLVSGFALALLLLVAEIVYYSRTEKVAHRRLQTIVRDEDTQGSQEFSPATGS